jgi:hypothetical protein
MSIRRFLWTAGALCVVSVSALAQKSTITPVTSIISDYDSGVAPALQMQSDKAGAYTNTRGGQISTITSTGIWSIDLYYAPRGITRTICLAFDQPIAGSGPNGGAPVAPASTCYRARLSTECDNYGNNPLTLPAGQEMTCPMNVHFDANNKTYDLHMNPVAKVADFSETNPVTISCLYPASGAAPCSQWLIRPSATYLAPDGTTWLRNVANLSQEISAKSGTIYVKQGDFNMSFSIIVTNP